MTAGDNIKVHDLTLKISNSLPTHVGDPIIVMKPKVIFEKSGYNVLSITMGTHSGTHIDVPFHVIEDGKKLDDAPLDKYVGDAIFVEAEKASGQKIVPGDLDGWDIKEGDIVIVRTGWEEKKYKPDYFLGFPYFSEEAADYLISKKIKSLGVDTPSVDGKEQKGVFHKKILNAGIGVIESLINLGPLVGKMMFFSALPMRLEGADGSPVRAVAIEGI